MKILFPTYENLFSLAGKINFHRWETGVRIHSYNLEPVCNITLAMLFFGEAKGLNPAFHAGLGLHLLSVLRETQEAIRCKGA